MTERRTLILTTQSLSDECRQYSSVIQAHTRPIGIEDTYNAGLQPVIGVVCHRNGFLETFRFIINTSWANWIHVSVILFSLGMHQRITINFRRRCHQYSSLLRPSET